MARRCASESSFRSLFRTGRRATVTPFDYEGGRVKKCLFVAAAVLCAAAVSAQQAPPAAPAPAASTPQPPPPTDIALNLKRQHAAIRKNLSASATKMAEADYAFRPQGVDPVVRTFGQFLIHIANANYHVLFARARRDRESRSGREGDDDQGGHSEAARGFAGVLRSCLRFADRDVRCRDGEGLGAQQHHVSRLRAPIRSSTISRTTTSTTATW